MPAAPSAESFLLAEIRSIHLDYPHWGASIGVYLRSGAAGYEIVGIERGSPEIATFPMN